ncbi:hypothetical protein FQ087_14640 [Sporosarcina sp. ANT_H38]|uniref:hypothetical protein n=1 Tax=Sporosarcina sp. ANT_H38 TaxID=2597358 RepID=UPI0011F27E78|nr:hypothetical protein [Sporosarcina sp. ANT_H38]KAA0955822.1 hypothetical protein FQ087_14640 [Sporosarcina sp. ANT_H38]
MEKSFSEVPFEEGGLEDNMTKSDGKYPNKEDLEPKVKGVANSDELPLADPSDSNTSDVFRKNSLNKTGENEQSAFGTYKTDTGYNKPKSDEQYSVGEENKEDSKFDQETHDKWNEEKPNEDPFKP